jgi:hypothetical protein
LNHPVIVIPRDGYLPSNTSPGQWPSTLDLNCTRSHSLPAPPPRFNPRGASSGPGAVLSQADFKIVGTEKRFSILAHQLRRRIPPISMKPGGLPLHRCSAALLGMTTLASRFAHRSPERPLRAASRDRKIISSGASSRLAPLPLPKEPWHCLPAEIGPLVTCRTHLAVAGFQGRPGPPAVVTIALKRRKAPGRGEVPGREESPNSTGQ